MIFVGVGSLLHGKMVGVGLKMKMRLCYTVIALGHYYQ